MLKPDVLTKWIRHLVVGAALLATANAFAEDQPGAREEGEGLSLVVLGSGGPGATGRAGSGYLVVIDQQPRILVDAGPGTFARVGEAGLDLSAVDTVLLTHLHVDHAGELPGLVKARAISTRTNIDFKVFGPGGRGGSKSGARFPSTSRFVDLLFGHSGAFPYLRDFAGRITFHAHDLGPRSHVQKIVQRDGLVVSAIAGHHRDAPAIIYRVDYGGKSITFTGDIDAAGHATLKRIAQDTDLLVFNCVVLDPPGSSPVLYTLHTAPRDIGLLAAHAKAKGLLLGHLNPAIDREQNAVRSSVAASFGGAVSFAKDGLTIVP